MLEVYDRQMRKLAILHLAYNRVEEKRLNEVGTFSFSLPANDPKAEHCQPFYFIRNDGGDFYRVLADGLDVKDTGERTYTCEHCIATLVDDIMFGSTILGNVGMYTRDVIAYILNKQTVKHWRLGECDFAKEFEYGLESENLLNAMFSIANLFAEPYQWVYSMSTYPWTVSLKKIDVDANPQFYIRAGKNLLSSSTSRTGVDVCTRLYLLGYGEGDNQLTISGINDGKPYLQSPAQYIDRYGLISKVYVDRSFEDAESLMERGRALLAVMQDPPRTRTFQVADLYEITKQTYDDAKIGGIVRLAEDGTTTYITGIKKNLEKPGDMTVEMSTSPTNIAAGIADIADRQRIEQVYSQGATQIYAQSIQANANTSTQAVLNFFIPDEMRIINKVKAKISIESFRSYSRVTSGGGQSTSTSSDGGGGATTSGSDGGSTQTSTVDGGTSLSTAQESTGVPAGGYSTSTSSITSTGSVSATTGSYTVTVAGQTGTSSGSTSSTGLHSHTISHGHTLNSHSHSVPSHSHTVAHYHDFNHNHLIPGHTHALGSHSHRVTVPSHTHSVSIPSHSHSVTIPNHTHNVEQGIFRFGSPSGAKIYVNGTEKFSMEREREVDLTEHLLDGSGKIPRNSWIRLGVLPNDLAYITIDIYVQGFVQSRGGGSY